jgi:tRNA(Ile)-lysidine synthase
LLHLLRGCGTDGLRGLTQEGFLIQAQPEVSTIKNQKSKINVVRPLLQLSREQTSQYCHQQNIQFRVDSSNKDWQFHRNRIRQELIPHLAEYYNPAIKQAVARLAVLAGQDAEYLDSQAAHAFEHAMVAADSSSICLDADALEELPEVLRSRVARMAVQHMLGHLLDIDYSFYLWLNTVLEGRQVARRTLPGSPSIEVLVEHHFVTMRRMEAHKSALPVEYSLDPPCTLDLAPFGCQIRFFDPNEQPLRDSARIMHRQELDADSINPPYVVRNWQPGDSIQPLGMEGTRKLQDIFVDRKIPRAVRDQVPIVCDRDGIVWVGGLVVSHRARITPSTKRRLTLELTILA